MTARQTSCQRLVQLLCITFTLLAVPPVWGAVFQKFLGIAYDNPAKINQTKCQQAILGASYNRGTADFTGRSVGQVGEAEGKISQAMPYFRYVTRLSDWFVAGLDITEPYATSIEYPPNSIVRYISTQTHVQTTNFVPKIGFNFCKLAFGFGVSAQYIQANLNRMVPSAVPGVGDRLFQNQGTDWGYGWQAGAQYSFTPYSILGISYFSRISHDLEGPSFLPGLPITSANGTVPLPATWGLNFSQALSQQWGVGAQINYTQWDILQRFQVNNSAIGRLFPPIIFNYHNTWRAALGAQYIVNPTWTLRAGAYYDEGPQDAADRSVAIPAQDFYGIGVGLHYQIAKPLAVDFDYYHAIIPDAAVNNVNILSFGNFELRGDAADLRLSWNI